MRVEAELLGEDGELLGSPDFEDRTHEQRSADALLRLMEAIGTR